MENRQSNRYYFLRKITIFGVFLALSLVMFVIESYLPSLYIPGAKVGLANIFTIFNC